MTKIGSLNLSRAVVLVFFLPFDMIMMRDAETLNIRAIVNVKLSMCDYRANFPEFLEQKTHLQRDSQEYKEGKCKSGYSCLKEDQCAYAQDLREKFINGDNYAKEKLIGLICDRKERKFCCPDFSLENDPSWLPGRGECGINPNTSPALVVSGFDTTPGLFPFTALLGYPSKNKKWSEQDQYWVTIDEIKYKCGGVLINHWYIVTAAHCHGSSRTSQISSVRLGEWEVGRDPDCLNNDCLNTFQDFEISNDQVTVHEDYTRTHSNVHNDIALIRLDRPAVLNNGVQIVCLPINPSEAAKDLNVPNIRDGLTGKFAIAIGWGYAEYDPFATDQQGDFSKANVASSVQRRVGLPVLSTLECSGKFKSFKPTLAQICAGGEKNKDTCRGDSGGPLLLSKVGFSGKPSLYGLYPWYLLGITSFGSRVCGSSQPAVFTRVEKYIPWIMKQIGYDIR